MQPPGDRGEQAYVVDDHKICYRSAGEALGDRCQCAFCEPVELSIVQVVQAPLSLPDLRAEGQCELERQPVCRAAVTIWDARGHDIHLMAKGVQFAVNGTQISA